MALRSDEHDLDQLDRTMNDIDSLLARITEQDRLKELRVLWRQPGWTSEPEFFLFSSVLDDLLDRVSGVDKAIEVVSRGARMIGA